MPDITFGKPFQFTELKAVDDAWEVSGYVSTFGNIDLGRDVVRSGAFKKTLKSGPKVRFLMSHDPSQILGVPIKLHEDEKGLFGRFKISKTRLGEEAHTLIKDGALDSFSIGFVTEVYTIDDKEDLRYIDEATLYEVSMVSIPMNPEAQVTGWKQLLLDPKTESLAEQMNRQIDEIKTLIDTIKAAAAHSDRPLTEKKRQELSLLLESCSGWDAVRTQLTAALASSSSLPGQVAQAKLRYELAERRKRLADILQE